MTAHRPITGKTAMPTKKTKQLKTTGLPRDAALEAAEVIVDAALARTDPDRPTAARAR
ncbi:MAG TPA: hypothetical protein VFO62_10510 [Candidatus Binatia bacterium]|nr:hypothetical protein [Candidatus Binatia bacterium]